MPLFYTGSGTARYTENGVLESKLVQNIEKALGTHFPGAFITKIHGNGYQRAGIPDLFIQYGGVGVWLEVKRPGGDTSRVQKVQMDILRHQGAFVGVVDSVQDAIFTVKTALDIKNKAYTNKVHVEKL